MTHKQQYEKEFNIDINKVAKEVRKIQIEKEKPCYDDYGNPTLKECIKPVNKPSPLRESGV